MNKKILSLIFTFFSTSLLAYDHTIVTQTTFTVTTPSVEKKFEDTVLNPEGFLKRFNPVGVQILKKTINGNDFEYVVVKRILGISKTFNLLGTITFERTLAGCPSPQKAYLAQIDFTRSGPAVTDTIENFTLLLCGSNISSNQMAFKSTNTLFYLGDRFGSLLERFAKSLINDQVIELTNSIKAEAISKSN